ncbi:MAG: hypothetical protein J5493_07875 [Lachnospiraceae bacterium]|nr:hypothetical protein [Lachnospiraceae bacterium]
MKEFIEYLTRQIDAGRDDIMALEKDGRQDDADFAKVRTNIYEVCRTVTNALKDRPNAGAGAVKAQLERFRTAWQAALDKAREHGDARNIVVEETKLAALADVAAHFPEADR